MTREQKLDRAVREAMRLIRGDGPISEDRADEAWRILRAALSTPADAPCATCGDGLFTGSTTLGTLRPCPDCVPADAPAPAEQEAGRWSPDCGCDVGDRPHTCKGRAPPPRPDEDGECPACAGTGTPLRCNDCDEIMGDDPRCPRCENAATGCRRCNGTGRAPKAKEGT